MKYSFIFLAFFIFIACDNVDKHPEIINDSTLVTENNTSRFIRTQDSILKNYASAVRLINQIDEELTKLSNASKTIETKDLESDILQKIEYLSFQLRTKNDEIKDYQSKLKNLSRENDILQEKYENIQNLLAEKDKSIEIQKIRISDLEKELQIVINERDYALERKDLAEKVTQETIAQKNTAYYVIGTEEELEKRNIIVMEGEGFLGIGGRYVPSSDAVLSTFKQIDIMSDTLLPFAANYDIEQIVSNHNKKYIEIIHSPTGESSMKIRSPEEFWSKDKTLIIIVEKIK